MDKDALALLALCFTEKGDELYGYVKGCEGLFSLSDMKACNQPRIKEPCPENCNREVLRIFTPRLVTVVAFEDWLGKPNESKCDYIIFDSDVDKKRFAFCELTCSLESYVADREYKRGKRAKAFSQLSESWRLINENHNPMFRAHLLQYVDKIGIFGWRDRKSVNHGGAMNSMRRFTMTPGSRSAVATYDEFMFGEKFRFIQVKYPNVFDWASTNEK